MKEEKDKVGNIKKRGREEEKKAKQGKVEEN